MSNKYKALKGERGLYKIDKILEIIPKSRYEKVREPQWHVSFIGFPEGHNRKVIWSNLSKELQQCYYKKGNLNEHGHLLIKNKDPEFSALFDTTAEVETQQPPLEVRECPQQVASWDGSIYLERATPPPATELTTPPTKKRKAVDYYNFQADPKLFTKYTNELNTAWKKQITIDENEKKKMKKEGADLKIKFDALKNTYKEHQKMWDDFKERAKAFNERESESFKALQEPLFTKYVNMYNIGVQRAVRNIDL